MSGVISGKASDNEKCGGAMRASNIFPKFKQPRMAWLASLASGVSLLALSGPAFAQDKSEEAAKEDVAKIGTPTTATPDGDTDAHILVVGSRIQKTRPSADLVTVIDVDNPLVKGVIDAAALVYGSPATAGRQTDATIAGNVPTGGEGTKRVSLRGLGDNRTLLLVNGRTLPPGGLGSFAVASDLNTVPGALLDKVEILKQGASSVYGSEAIAGVINFRTIKGLDGLRMKASTSQPLKSGGADYVVSAAYGKVFDNGGLTLAGEYYQQNELNWGDRSFSRCEQRPRIDPETGKRSDIDPATGLPRCVGSEFNYLQYTRLGGGAGPRSFTLVPDANASFRGVPGFRAVERGPDGSIPGAEIDDTESLPETDLIGRTQRLNLHADGEIDLEMLGGLTLGFEAGYSKRKTISDVRKSFVLFNIGPTSALNPFFNPSNPSSMAFINAFVPNKFYDPNTEINSEALRLLLNLKGKLPMGWRWSVDYQYGQNHSGYRRSYLSAPRVNAALNAVRGPNGLTCVDPDGGECVVLNPLDPGLLNGSSVPKKLKDYLTGSDTTRTETSRHEITYVVDGNLFDLPAGAIGAALGFNYRKDQIHNKPTRLGATGNIYMDALPEFEIGGTQNILGIFGEFEVPLFKGGKFSDDVVLNLSGRYTDYGKHNDFTYKGSLRWTFSPEYTFRASYATSFRAPNLFESGGSKGEEISAGLMAANPFLDPCYFYGVGNADPIIAANCAAQGLSPTFSAPPPTVLSGGNPNLKAETGKSFTIGMVMEPSWLPLSLSVDYYNIEVRNGIESNGSYNITQGCYLSPNLSSPYCDKRFIGPRDASGRLTYIDERYQNTGREFTDGIDIELKGKKAFPRFDIGYRGEVNYTLKRSRQLVPGLPTTYLDGFIGSPKWRANFELFLDYKDLHLSYGLRYMGPVSSLSRNPEFAERPEFRNLITKIDAYTYHDLSLSYDFDAVQVELGVSNLLDKKPPVISDVAFGSLFVPRSGNVPVGAGYDIRGRSAFISLKGKF